ncbi:MAG: hypothetical protein RMI91_13370 [Gemmatales bacterium]|nr:hypothetical protein [Gemmatales bacterium]MDW7995635.1 hypothetical protein [Gemmatales bacterium]
MAWNSVKRMLANVALAVSASGVWAADPLKPPAPQPTAPQVMHPEQGHLVGLPAHWHQCADGCAWLYGSAEALWLRRTDSRRENLTFNDVPVFVLNTDAGEFDHEIGARFLVGMFLDRNTSVEALYFGLHDWSKMASVTDPAQTLQPYWGQFGVPGGLDDSAFTDAFAHGFQYDSRLHNVELNLRQWYSPYLSTLVGFRYVYVRDKFAFFSFDDPGVPIGGPGFGLYQVNTKNHLLGLQIGADGSYPVLWDNLVLGIRGKAGLFINSAKQTSRFFNNPTGEGPITDAITDEDGNRLASLVEVGAYVTYWITPNIAVRGGYDLIYVAGLALAPENLDNSPLPLNARSNLKDNGDIIYHGPSIGVEFRW